MSNPEFSIVIPVYNASKVLGELCDRITMVFDHYIKKSFEIILVNDFSKDNSWETMCLINQKDSRVKIVNLAKNVGQHNTILCGLNLSRGDLIITMDDDLQHPPEEIPKLILAIVENPDVDVVCGEYDSKKHSLLRNLGTKTMNHISAKIFNRDPSIKLTSFRIIKRKTAQHIAEINVTNPRIGQLIMYVTQNIINTKVNHDERKYGRSGYSFARLSRDFVLNIVNTSALPLKFVSYIGVFSSILSFIYGFYLVFKYLFLGSSVQGWTSTVVIMVFFFGLVLLSLGIIGEYLIRILMETKKIPNYIIKEKRVR